MSPQLRESPETANFHEPAVCAEATPAARKNRHQIEPNLHAQYLFSIAASATGASRSKPIWLGCSPSIEYPFFSMPFVIHQRGKIIGVDGVDFRGVLLHPRVQLENVRGRTLPALRTALIIADRRHRAQHHLDTVRLRQLRHGLQILFDHGQRLRSGVARDVVGSGQNHHRGRASGRSRPDTSAPASAEWSAR